ncbi:hypothetical protein FACS189430_06200 [Bacteroidia bacterium]|nr:hypothetical protein FACS189430_06200 [Bacteroidia bacterium]
MVDESADKIEVTEGGTKSTEKKTTTNIENEGINPKSEGINPENEGINPESEGINSKSEGINPKGEGINLLLALERWLKKLRNAGKIAYHGSKKTGGYRIQ